MLFKGSADKTEIYATYGKERKSILSLQIAGGIEKET
jgi:hypothetical protein